MKRQLIVFFMVVSATAAGLATIVALAGCEPANKAVHPAVAEESSSSRPVNVASSPDRPARTTPPAPPDLTGCTRIEVTYPLSTRWAVGLLGHEAILSPEENKYIDSLDKIVVDDPNRIKAVAESLRPGTYEGSGYTLATQHSADVVCYRGEERLTSFRLYFSRIRTREGHWFKYKSHVMPLADYAPQLVPLSQRGACASNLYCMGYELRDMASKGLAWPAPDQWCDALPRRRVTESPGAADRIAKEFVCPGAGEGKCHYAMNAACRPDSPPDTVLLFEAKAGWNQQGGPELFTFDHHTPKGGLVLLRDGTIKFIRTKEELASLRWNEWSRLVNTDSLLGVK